MAYTNRTFWTNPRRGFCPICTFYETPLRFPKILPRKVDKPTPHGIGFHYQRVIGMHMYNPTESIGSVHNDMATLAAKNTELTSRNAYLENQADILRRSRDSHVHKIANVKEYITEVYMETGYVEDELQHIAELLEISLTKRIAGTATINITWEAQAPLDFDPSDLDLIFSVDVRSSDIEDFEYGEDGIDIEPETGY